MFVIKMHLAPGRFIEVIVSPPTPAVPSQGRSSESSVLKKKKKKQNRIFGKLTLAGDWVIKWLQLLSFLLKLFLLCVIPRMEGLRQSAGRAVTVFFRRAVTAPKNK